MEREKRREKEKGGEKRGRVREKEKGGENELSIHEENEKTKRDWEKGWEKKRGS